MNKISDIYTLKKIHLNSQVNLVLTNNLKKYKFKKINLKQTLAQDGFNAFDLNAFNLNN